jgi:hypothetical protein
MVDSINKSVKLDQFWDVIIKCTATRKFRVRAIGRDNAKKKAQHWLEIGCNVIPLEDKTTISANASYDQWSAE